MASEDDEFDSYDFAEFTADELALVDESIMANSNVTANANRGGPAITVEVEQSANNISHNDQLTRGLSSNATVLLSTRQRQASPFQQFRSWNKVLSVSDLVSPAWYVTMRYLE
jgi:exonuclease V